MTAKSIHIDGVEDLKNDDWQFVIDINLTGGKGEACPVSADTSMLTELAVMYSMRAQLKNSQYLSADRLREANNGLTHCHSKRRRQHRERIQYRGIDGHGEELGVHCSKGKLLPAVCAS